MRICRSGIESGFRIMSRPGPDYRSKWPAAVLVVLLLPVLFVLSMGPLYYLVETRCVSSESYVSVYG